MTYTNIWIADKPMNVGLQESIIDLKSEQVYDDLMTLNGRPLLVSSFILSVYDCIVPQDILEKRLAVALAKHSRTLYYANWTQSTVVYRKAI
jgi:hypothetical protein